MREGRTLLSIHSHWNGLTKTEKRVAQYILEFADDVLHETVTELAAKTGVGETTVIRMCRHLQFRGFQEFKLSLAQDLAKPAEYLPQEIGDDDDAPTVSVKMIALYLQALDRTRELLLPGRIADAVHALAQAKNIRFFGVGSSGLIAMQAAHSFTQIGKPSSADVDAYFQAVQASRMTPEDAAVGISISGSTQLTIDNLNMAREAGAKTIAITGRARSPVAKAADTVLLTVSRDHPQHEGSQAGCISQLAVIDILKTAVSFQMKGLGRRNDGKSEMGGHYRTSK